ncbi:hypothetical protein RCL_jg6254.t1 [Rhizophagus clarus]|uniref:Uncharacterized protein n=1 Tax=Rhizophagus clarus TaxID=94130 RepID=A0A8H3L2Y6_9GLOM|nr:hypothetical protein RCL_jg6254.t1 [Rhizophagus clarus]
MFTVTLEEALCCGNIQRTHLNVVLNYQRTLHAPPPGADFERFYGHYCCIYDIFCAKLIFCILEIFEKVRGYSSGQDLKLSSHDVEPP